MATLGTAGVDRGALLEQLQRWGRTSPEMQGIIRVLGAAHGGSRAEELAYDLARVLLMRAVGVHERRLDVTCGTLHDVLNRLLGDREALRGAGSAARGAAAREADLRTLVSALDELRTLEQTVTWMLGDSEHDLRTAVRSQLQTAAGPSRSSAPVPEPSARAVRPGGAGTTAPRPAPGTGEAAVAAGRRLFEAIEAHPPAPKRAGRTGPHKPYTAEQLGRQSKEVSAAALALVDAFRAEHGDRAVAAAVRNILAGADDLVERNRMAIAVLVAHGRLRPGRAVPRRGPQYRAGAYQEKVTGTPFECTGVLPAPVGSFETVSIGGIVNGWVREAKHTQALLSESGRPLRGRGGRPWQQHRTADVVTEMRGQPPLTARELIAGYEEKAGMPLAAEMERQLVFAQDNGLYGVEWVTNSPELRDEFERIFTSEVGTPRSAVRMYFSVVRD
ncbi:MULTISPECIES: hypothetical protein [unclassified Streptomyces]|uniref:hypothetical protein n=1 Tax=unclassified Streptomyces TaxID=2593676 RepID=UPI00225A0BAA|nr:MULTISPECIES: hypothetical protein [unclassified Streptomyces]MCX4650249.1 hypothetical protein [Streptomyces sp. NBC_01446]MCX5327754.1 hypothetical protein [Streptomyces sp. NBC_00120]